jgi:hypothetical protein
MQTKNIQLPLIYRPIRLAMNNLEFSKRTACVILKHHAASKIHEEYNNHSFQTTLEEI